MSRYSDSAEERMAENRQIARYFSLAAVVALCLVAAGMYGCPQYGVWRQGLAGEAELRRAEQTRQIAIEEAKAVELSATHRAKAEVERAKGVAEANEIIGDSLRGNEAYLRYLYIDQLGQRDGVIYVPTEAGLPILEAGRFAERARAEE